MTRIQLMMAVGVAVVATSVAAQEQHGHVQQGEKRPAETTTQVGPHGGTVQVAGLLQVETVIEPGGLRLFVYDQKGQPVQLNRARGLAVLQVSGDKKRYRYDLYPEIGRDQSANSLAVAVDLTRIGGRDVRLAYQLVGVPGADRRPAKFTTVATVPMTEAQRAAAAIEAQGVCPVSGRPLGGMGKPVPVTVGNQTVYVCCAGCIDKVTANPAKYFGAKPSLNMVKATEADADAIDRQKLCPVMDEPLGSMGTPLKVSGLRREVFLCCKGCLKFLEKEPEKYLAKLPPLPGPAVTKATKVDARFVSTQKVCPVMDEPLDAMGGPFRTVVNGRVVYLCCPGCAKKLHASPERFLKKLADQGVRPPVAR